MAKTSRFPEKIGGMSFGTADYQVIQSLCKEHGVSESHVVRSCVGIGLQVYYSVRLRSQIEKAAEHYSTSERTIIQEAVHFGLSQWREQGGPQFRQQPRQEPLEEAETELQSGRTANYPMRVGGLAFSTADHKAIQRISSSLNVSEAHVVRECVSIGLAVYADDRFWRWQIEEAALAHDKQERDIVYAAVQEGLDEALMWLRVKPVLQIRSNLRAEDPELDLKLTEYIHGVMRQPQPVRLPDPIDQEQDDAWCDAADQLADLHQTWSKNPQDGHDRALVSYLDGRRDVAEERDRRRHQERRAELLELRGRVDDEAR